MGTPIGQDLTVYYGGTVLTGTTGNVTRALKQLPSFSPFQLRPEGDYVGATDVIAEAGEPAVEAMKIVLSMAHEITGVATALAAERECMDELRAWNELVNPFDGVGTLRFDRSTAAAAAVSTEVLRVRPISVPRYSIEVVDGDGMVNPTRAFLKTDTEFWCPLPYFYNRVATTKDYVADTAADSDTCANPGIAPCGVRFEVTAITDSPTQVTIANTTNGYSFVWKKNSGNFAAGDYIDWYYTDQREEAHKGGTSIVSADGLAYFELACGNNTVTATRTAGTGTVSITASWKPRYLSL